MIENNEQKVISSYMRSKIHTFFKRNLKRKNLASFYEIKVYFSQGDQM